MIYASDFHSVVNMLHDFLPVDAREFPALDVFAGEPVAFEKLAGFIAAATLLHFLANGFVDFGIGLLGVAKFLAEEPHVVVDLDDAPLCGQVLHHLIGQVARSITKNAAGRV